MYAWDGGLTWRAWRGRGVVVLGCLMAACALIVGSAAPSRSGEPGPLGYTFTRLAGPSGSASSVTAVWTDELSNVFLAAGSATAGNGETHAMLWQNGVPLDLGTLGGNLSAATGVINTDSSIVVVGLSRNAADQIHGFIWRNGSMTQLPTLGGAQSSALGIDLGGMIFGYSDLNPSGRHACYWSGAPLAVTDLSTTPLQGSKAWGYGGGYCGYTSTPLAISHAALWQNGGMTDLGTLGGAQSVACSCNADFDPATKVVGESQFDGGSDYHAFLWQSGVMTDLGTLGGTVSTAYDINAPGEIVGKARLATGAQRAALWAGGVAVDLNTRLLNVAGGILTEARAVDNRGYIVGNGSFTGVTQGYMLRPVFELGLAPTLSTVTPNSGSQGQTRTVTLAGSNFVPGAAVSFGAGITVNSAVVSGFGGEVGVLADHLLTVSVTIAADAPAGLRDVTVTNPDSQSVTKTNAFTVIDPDAVPELAAFTFTPAMVRGGARQSGTVTLTGAAPAPRGAKVTFTSSNPNVKPPRAVVIKKGKTAPPKPFVYKSKKVRAITTATITASYGGVSKSVDITLTP